MSGKLKSAKAGFNGFLDVARTTYKEINGDVLELNSDLNGNGQFYEHPSKLTL
jgi:hypothetical protein